MRIVAMIPARLGSTRVKRKNLRFLGSKPLLAWSVTTALASKVFDEVWVNTESDEIAQLAAQLGAKCYRRSQDLAAGDVTSEHFVRDFVEHVRCDVLMQITPTSPFITTDAFERAEVLMTVAETVLPVRRIQAEVLTADLDGVNVNRAHPMVKAEDLRPVYALCNGVFSWKVDAFMQRQNKFGAATLSGRAALLELDGDEAIDIDTEADFAAAEAVLVRRRAGDIVPRYWTPTACAETDDDGGVLLRDGVPDHNLSSCPGTVLSLPELLAHLPTDVASAQRVVNTPTGAMTVISQLPGEGNRPHFHTDVDETWLVLEGEYIFDVAGHKMAAKTGDLVSIPRGVWHQATAVGTSRAVRLAMSRDGASHVYSD